MEQIIWTEKLKTGIVQIDDQHQSIIILINKLIEIEFNHILEKIETDAILTELIEYSINHFKEEERLMQEIEYPLLEEHQGEHYIFKYKIAMFCKSASDSNKTITQEMLLFLKNWFINHITNSDMKINTHLQSHPKN